MLSLVSLKNLCSKKEKLGNIDDLENVNGTFHWIWLRIGDINLVGGEEWF